MSRRKSQFMLQWGIAMRLRQLKHLATFRHFAGTCVCLLGALTTSASYGELIYTQDFEGDASGYTLEDPGYEPLDPINGWSPGIWGLNTQGSQIGLVSSAPANRAAIAWNHDPVIISDDFTDEALSVWVSLADWSMGIANPADRAGKRITFFPGYQNEAVGAVHDAFVAAGYADANITEAPLDIDIMPGDADLVIHSSELASTVFSTLPIPVISFSASDHDDTAIAGLGQVLNFTDPVTFTVPAAMRNHPALGGNGTDGVIEWTNTGIPLQGIGKTHRGGQTLAELEDPNTGEFAPGIFIVPEGSPLLGAWNPTPQGSQYIVGSALNKFGDALDRVLELRPVDVSGKTDVKVAIALAATAADFEGGDYLRIDVDPTNSGNFQPLAELFGVDDATSPCYKGLATADESICLADDFNDYVFDIPSGATNMVLRFTGLTTWGNEIFAIDNVRVFTGQLAATGDFNQNGQFDAEDLELLGAAQRAGDAAFDLTGDGMTNGDDRLYWVHELKKT
ncbi:MAG: hypothetical protein KDB23_06505, partial [Planctomycetales bacterium]|nr:hypothetical protein [Planctomycetales bacterium]